jgi:hypothetical protein
MDFPKDLVQGEVPLLGIIRNDGQVVGVHPIDLGKSEIEQAPAVFEIRQGLDE